MPTTGVVKWKITDSSINPPTWQANHTYALNAQVRPTTPNGHVYLCMVASTSQATEPAWPTWTAQRCGAGNAWAEHGPDGTVSFLVNPNKMSSPWRDRRIEVATVLAPETGTHLNAGGAIISEGARPPKEWQFSGILLDADQLQLFIALVWKPGRIYLYDHWKRAYEIVVTKIDVDPVRWTPRYPWRHEYTLTAIVLSGPNYTEIPPPNPPGTL